MIKIIIIFLLLFFIIIVIIINYSQASFPSLFIYLYRRIAQSSLR